MLPGIVAVQSASGYPSIVRELDEPGVVAMRIQWLSIDHVPPLEDIDIEHCDKQVNLFIGPNASGKSTILRAIEDLSSSWGPSDEFDDADAYPIYGKGYKHAQVHIGVNYGCPTNTSYYPHGADCAGSGASIWEALPFLYIPTTRVNLRPQNIFDPTIQRPEPYGFNLTWDAMLDQHFRNSWGAFNGEYVEDFVGAFRENLRFNRNQREQLRKALTVGQTCAKSICQEVIRDDVPQAYVEFIDEADIDEDDPEFYPTGRVVHHGMGIGTTDDFLGEQPLYAGALSSGTQGTLLWIWALAIKMAHHYDWQEGWQEKPAVLLIDEIENHLHPTWQRRVIPALLHHFPGLQIFATTHSPFVVAGLKAGQVHLLKREHGVVTASTHEEDIIGWTADEILRTMMGVDEPTDQLTVDRAERLRQLRQKVPLTTEEEDELNTLRRQVNETLLSKGGSLEAQRERYADLMQRFLLSRQTDLSQDGE